MKNHMMRFWGIFGAIVIVVSTFGCEKIDRTSRSNYFMGMDMKLPSNTTVKRNEFNDTISYLKGKNLSEGLETDQVFLKLQSNDLLPEIALAFISANTRLFRIEQPASELLELSVKEDDLGFKHIRFQQVFKGIPVRAAEINVHLDKHNHVYLVQGNYIPTPASIDINPVVSGSDVEQIVTDNLKIRNSQNDQYRSEMIIFSSPEKSPCLAYRAFITVTASQAWELIVDATTGAILDKTSTVYDGASHLRKAK